MSVESYPFQDFRGLSATLTRMPFIPIQLHGASVVTEMALLDTGATVGVLPHDLGTSLGLDWAKAKILPTLAGNLAHSQSRGVAVECVIGAFPKILLAFAWTASNDSPLILGQQNFFREFDVCFFNRRNMIEIRKS